MPRSSLRVARFVSALLVMSGLALAAGAGVRVAYAAPLDPEGTDWEGLSELVRMAQAELGASRVIVAHDLDLGTLSPANALVLVHPTRDLDVDELNVFMEAGGRVVLLDDYGSGDALLGHFGVRRVPLPEHPAEMLRSNPALAVAHALGSHRAVRDVTRVATNHATGLVDQGLAHLLVVRGQDEPDVTLAIAGVVGRGRFLAVGDGSIAMNAMLRYPGNLAFALALVRYAGDTDAADAAAPADRAGTAPGKVYLLANDFVLSGGYGRTPPLRRAVRLIRDAFESLRHGVPPTAAYVGSLAVALAIVAWTGLRAGRTHRPTLPRFVRQVPLVAQGGVAGHAAVLGAPGTSRVLVMLELKSALEEAVATKLGLDRVTSTADLVARARAGGWLGQADARALEEELTRLARFEAQHLRSGGGGGAALAVSARVPAADIAAAAARVRRLVAAVAAGPRGKVEPSP
jgi:hypothetical protein